MRQTLLALLLAFVSAGLGAFAQDVGEYYIYHTYYQRILGEKSDGATPGLSAAGTNETADSYVFVAESSGIDGYVLLRQKSSDKYLAASTSNTYSVVFQSSRSTANAYLWKIHYGTDGSLSNKRSSDCVLGCDSGKEDDTYVSIFYDKEEGDSLAEWYIFKANGTFDESFSAFAVNELSSAIDYGTTLMSQTSDYTESQLALVSSVLAEAQAMYASIEDYTPEELLAVAQTLRDSIASCCSAAARILLSDDDFDMESTFTVALSSVTFASEGSTADMVLRGEDGTGRLLTLGQGSITVGGETYSASTENESTDFHVVYTEGSMTLYIDKELVATIETEVLPQYTEAGTEGEWSILRSANIEGFLPEVISASTAVAPGETVTDSHGNTVRYVLFAEGQSFTLSEAIDFHIIQEDTPLTNTAIDLGHEKAWVIFDNTLPSEVISSYLSSFTVSGSAAVNGENVRVGVYLNGAVVMPYDPDGTPFVGYTETDYAGDEIAVGLGANELGSNSNKIRSFTLKRGFMAVLASGSEGSGYSRVYVADHQDIEVDDLPLALDLRISSVHVKKWNYVSKKGWCSTNSSSSIATECKKMRATWFYTWSADRSSTDDTEYIPIRQHLYWPSISQITSCTNSTHVLSFNEPEHSEQHTSDKCTCGGTISEWTACSKTPDLQVTGMRIGSPAPTDASWLTTYINYCNNMAYRCDFVAIHCYWGTNEAANAASWYSQLKAIYDATKRPIWITEWNNGASWTTESWPDGYSAKLEQNRKAIKEILNVLDTCSFVERYAIYNWDSYYRAVINTDDGWVTPAGEVYRDDKSTFAYNADVQFTPVFWTPSLKEVTLSYDIASVEDSIVFVISNANGDMTDQLIIQKKNANGEYEDFYVETDRSVFDETSLSYTFSLTDVDMESDEFRVYVTTTSGYSTYSTETSLSYIVNPTIVATSKTEVEGWICQKSAANGYTKASSGDTYLEVWDSTPEGMYFDYFQDIEGLPGGVYELSAAVFNSTNGQEEAYINGHVGLYAQSDGLEYFAAVTEDSELDTLNRTTIPYIAVTNGAMRIGVKNIGSMTARWAGADNFELTYLGTIDDILPNGLEAFEEEIRQESDERYMALFVWDEDSTQADASEVIINTDCNREDTYGWTASTVSTSTGEGYDGDTSNPYWNYWSSSAYTASLSQDFDYLPAGEYSVGALVRGSAVLTLTLSADLTDGTDTLSVTDTITGTGLTTADDALYPNGWKQATIDSLIIETGDKLTITFEAVNAGGSAWYSVDHFTLTFKPVAATLTGIQSYETATTAADVAVSGSKGELLVAASQPMEIAVYSLSGVAVAKEQVRAGISSIPLPAGVYIVNGKKVLVK